MNQSSAEKPLPGRTVGRGNGVHGRTPTRRTPREAAGQQRAREPSDATNTALVPRPNPPTQVNPAAGAAAKPRKAPPVSTVVVPRSDAHAGATPTRALVKGADATMNDDDTAAGLSHRFSLGSTISGKSLSPPASVVYVFANPNRNCVDAMPPATSNASDSVPNHGAGCLDVPSVINVRHAEGEAQGDNGTANIANPEANGTGRMGEHEAGGQNAEAGRREERGGAEAAAANRDARDEVQVAWDTERRHLTAIAVLLVCMLVVSSVVYPTWTTLIPEPFRMSYSDTEQVVLFVATWSSVAAFLLHSLPVSSRLLMSAVVAVGGALFAALCFILGWILRRIYMVQRLSMGHVRRSMRIILVGMAILCGAVVIAYVAVAAIVSPSLFGA